MAILLAFIAIIPLLISLFILRKSRHRNPVFYFVSYQLIMCLGIFYLLDFDVIADVIHARILILSSFTIFLFCTIHFLNVDRIVILKEAYFSKPFLNNTKSQKLSLIFLFAISILVSVYYYVELVGYNLSTLALSGGLENSQDSFTTLRLQSYAGQDYKGSGPVNQFKNTIFPISLFSIYLMMSSRESWRKYFFPISLFYAISIPLFLYVITGTGQRTFLFFTIISLFLYFYNNKIVLNFKITLVVISLLLFTFSILSVFLGRADQSGVFEGVFQLFDRIIRSNQIGSVMGMRLIANREIPFGQEWMQFIVGLIPGQSGSILANEVHAYMFGSMRGTAPVNLWISTYHNFGYLGIPAVTSIIMTILLWLERFSLRIQKTITNEMILAFLFFYVAILPVGNPFQILNNGLMAIIFMAIFLKMGARTN